MVETQHAASLPKLSSEAVSEIQAVACSMSGRELEIVMHEIEVRFGSQIDGLCQVKPQGCAYVSEKVIDAHVVGALAKVVAVHKVTVEADAFRANSAHRGVADATNLACIHSVEVIENRPVGCEVLVGTASGPPCNFAIESKIAPDNEVGCEARIHSAAERLRRVVEII